MKYLIPLLLLIGCSGEVTQNDDVPCSLITRKAENNINGCWRVISLEHTGDNMCASVTKCEMFPGDNLVLETHGLVSLGDVRCDATCE